MKNGTLECMAKRQELNISYMTKKYSHLPGWSTRVFFLQFCRRRLQFTTIVVNKVTQPVPIQKLSRKKHFTSI